MKHEDRLRIFFNKNKIVGFFATRGKLWEKFAFYTSILINLMIILSYSEYFLPEADKKKEKTNPEEYNKALQFYRINDPRFLLQKDFIYTKDLIRIIGILNLIFSSLVVFFFFIKRAPLLLEKSWTDFYYLKANKFKKIFKGFKLIIKSLFICLQDYLFLYYICYIFFSSWGIILHPFFFVFHLTDFLRIEVLATVVKAMWNPRWQLILTFVLFTLIG